MMIKQNAYANCEGCGALKKKYEDMFTHTGEMFFCNLDCYNTFLEKHKPKHDPIDKPKHYLSHPSGIECIRITEHMTFTLGNAIKYIWRADLKNGVEDLEKARWYITREIDKRKESNV